MGNKGFPDLIKHNGQETTTDKGKADIFNKFFGSVFTEPNDNEDLPNLENKVNESLGRIQLEEIEVEKALSELDPSKSAGLDNIPTTVLKQCAQSIKIPLTKLFNRSLAEGTVPTQWKVAKICPVHKKGSKEEASNYRPISLLSVTSKTLERCIYNRIIPDLKTQLTPFQHGFISGKSTQTQLLEVYDKIGRIVDERGQVDSIFLDFSKAFDSVSHPHLVKKLQTFGIHGELLSWFSSYLYERYQITMINEESSEKIKVKSGVPQGSILGPLLFLIFINDMPDCLTDNTQIALYADDAKVFKTVDSIYDCLDLQEQLDHLIQWSHIWRLNFNVTKCKIITFSRKTVPHRYRYNIAGVPLERVAEMVDLGVTVQDNMLWGTQIRKMVSKANQNLYFVIRTIGLHAPVRAKSILYSSLVRSQLDYASVIWSPVTKQNLELLEKVQRKATRYICNYNNLDYKDRLTQSNLLPLSYRREALDCQFAHKGRSGVLGDKIKEMLTSRPARHNVRLNRGNTKIKFNKFRTETFGHFYTNRLPYIWNSLSDELRSITFDQKSSMFKTGLRKELLTRLLNKFQRHNTCTWVTKCRCSTCRT
jgi:hypothetical protein